MNFNPINIIILFGIVQCVVMIALIVRNRRWEQMENRILVSLLSVLLITLIPTFLGNSTLAVRYTFLQFAPFYLSLFIFPLLYLYVRSVYSGKLSTKAIMLQLVVPIVFWCYFTVVWIGTFGITQESKATWAASVGYFHMQTFHSILLLLFAIGYTSASVSTIRNLPPNMLSKEQKGFKIWVRTLVILLGSGVVLEVIATILGKTYGYWRGSPVDEWLGFSFTLGVKMYNAIILYGISLAAYLSFSSLKRKKRVLPTVEVGIVEKIIEKMQTDKLYLDPNLSLSKFSSYLDMSSNNLSGIFNNILGTTFNDFVNGYRVQEVIQLVKEGNNSYLTLEAISENAGFKSKTTFYRAFKKITSKTPTVYFQEGLQKN